MEYEFAKRLERVLNKTIWSYPFAIEHIRDQLGTTEFKIQRWWANKIDLNEKRVNILNSGIGFYSVPFAKEKGAIEINTYDMDPMTREIITGSNHNICNTIFDIDDINEAEVWINTSCEHTYPMYDIIPKGTICIMSSNNLRKRGHINPASSLDEFKEQLDISELMAMDILTFDFEDDEGKRCYDQYFVIGVK